MPKDTRYVEGADVEYTSFDVSGFSPAKVVRYADDSEQDNPADPRVYIRPVSGGKPFPVREGQLRRKPENKWYATDAEPRRNGTPGGDYQVRDAWGVRLLNDAIPGAVVDVDYYVERSQQDQSEVPAEPAEYGVTGMIQYTICTDRNDPGSTETWADIQYDNEADPLGYGDVEKADKAARFQAARWIANADKFMAWDGQPFSS